MKKVFVITGSLAVFLFCLEVLSQAAVPAASPTGLSGWIASHGGLSASALLLLGSLNILLSAVRQVLANWDGIPAGANLPTDASKLGVINKICIYLGMAIDYLQGNVQH